LGIRAFSSEAAERITGKFAAANLDVPEDALAILEEHGRRLRDRRSRRSARKPAADLKRLVSALRNAEKAARGIEQFDISETLGGWAQRFADELALAKDYEGQRDPDREEFLLAVIQSCRDWGADLGGGKEYRYLPGPTQDLLHAIYVAALGSEAPERNSIWKIVRRLRRVKTVAKMAGTTTFTADATVKAAR
jgi:hypothetical protein